MKAANAVMPALEELLPHRAPMLLIDALVEHGNGYAICRVCPRADGLFVRDGRVPALIAIEYMAQSVGAFAGLRLHATGAVPRPGYLIAAREVKLQTPWLLTNEELLVHVRCVWSDGPAGQFECVVRRGAEAVANATVTVYEPPEQADQAP